MIASHFSGGKSSIGRHELDAGIVDEDVDRAERRLGARRSSRRSRPAWSCRRRRIERRDAEFALDPGPLASISRGVAEAVEHDVRALPRQRAGDREADAAGRAGDERVAVLETSQSPAGGGPATALSWRCDRASSRRSAAICVLVDSHVAGTPCPPRWPSPCRGPDHATTGSLAAHDARAAGACSTSSNAAGKPLGAYDMIDLLGDATAGARRRSRSTARSISWSTRLRPPARLAQRISGLRPPPWRARASSPSSSATPAAASARRPPPALAQPVGDRDGDAGFTPRRR